MSRKLLTLVAVTDALMLAHWVFAVVAQLGLVHVPPDWMYARYDQPDVIAWNWSFLPLDLAFSAFGAAAVVAARRGDPIWRPLALISLTLTATSGLMAIAYWVIAGQFDPSWFITNLVLLVWPLFFLAALVRRLGADGAR
jgi:hypothetical protein